MSTVEPDIATQQQITGRFRLVLKRPALPTAPNPPLVLAIDGGPHLDLNDTPLLHITETDYGYPELRAVEDNRVQASGVLDRTRYWGSRPVTITGRIAIDWQARQGLPRMRQAIMDKLAPFMMPSARPWLYDTFDDGHTRRIMLRPDGFSRPQIADVQEIMLSFKSPTGVFEDDPPTGLRLVPEQPADGREYNLEFDRRYPPGTGTAWVADNLGNAPADWTARIFGPVRGPAIVNVTTKEAVDLPELELNIGEFVDISSRDHTVLADGIAENSRWQYVDYVATDWWQLPPGVSWLRFHTHWWQPPAQALFNWRHTWLL